MGDLAEIEIFDCMRENFRSAAVHCDQLAVSPRKGAIYNALRQELELIEGSCRQASLWRQDTRWLKIGLAMHEIHQRAGGWLRGYRMPDGSNVKVATGEMHQCFVMLAQMLRGLEKFAEQCRTERTGRIGMILPDARPGPHRDTRPVGYMPGMKARPSGLVVPDSIS